MHRPAPFQLKDRPARTLWSVNLNKQPCSFRGTQPDGSCGHCVTSQCATRRAKLAAKTANCSCRYRPGADRTFRCASQTPLPLFATGLDRLARVVALKPGRQVGSDRIGAEVKKRGVLLPITDPEALQRQSEWVREIMQRCGLPGEPLRVFAQPRSVTPPENRTDAPPNQQSVQEREARTAKGRTLPVEFKARLVMGKSSGVRI